MTLSHNDDGVVPEFAFHKTGDEKKLPAVYEGGGFRSSPSTVSLKASFRL